MVGARSRSVPIIKMCFQALQSGLRCHTLLGGQDDSLRCSGSRCKWRRRHSIVALLELISRVKAIGGATRRALDLATSGDSDEVGGF